MHFPLTVFVEPEHATTEAARHARVDELMWPHCFLFEVPPYETDCMASTHDESCCDGALTVQRTLNPSPKWRAYVLVGSGESCWEDAAPEPPSFALLGPDQGWSDQDSFYGRMVGADEDLTEWNRSFEAAARSYGERGYARVLVDYEAMTPGRDGLPEPRLDGLASLLPAFEAPDVDFGTWKGGEEIEPGVIRMPWFSHSGIASRFVHVAYADGWVRPFDWGRWSKTPKAQRLYHDRRALSDATVPDLVRLLTTIIRSERFGEGAIAGAMEEGVIAAVLRRIEQLRRDQ